MPPSSATRSPGTIGGYQGSVAATRTAGGSSSRTVAGREPCLGAPTVSTMPTHGPVPWGAGGSGPAGSASTPRPPIASTPNATGSSHRDPRFEPDALMPTTSSRSAAPMRATASAPKSPSPTAPAAAPTASHAARGTSVDRDERLQLVEGLLADELPRAEVVDARE